MCCALNDRDSSLLPALGKSPLHPRSSQSPDKSMSLSQVGNVAEAATEEELRALFTSVELDVSTVSFDELKDSVKTALVRLQPLPLPWARERAADAAAAAIEQDPASASAAPGGGHPSLAATAGAIKAEPNADAMKAETPGTLLLAVMQLLS